MLETRVRTALAMLAIFALALFGLPQAGWVTFVAAMMFAAAREWALLAGRPSRRAIQYAVFLSAATVLIGLLDDEDKTFTRLLCVASVVFWGGVAPLWLARHWVLQQGALPLGVLVLLPAGLALAALRELGSGFVLAPLALVWVADSAAYFAGKAFGKNKLAPSISPGKTWEGAAGGAAGVLLYGALVNHFSVGEQWAELPFVPLAATLLVFVALSILGDLFESLLKRHAGVKDSGTLLPGHGGMLDRIDSLTSTLPLGFLFLQLLHA